MDLTYLEMSTPKERHSLLATELLLLLYLQLKDRLPYLRKEDRGLLYERDFADSARYNLLDAAPLKGADLRHLNDLSAVNPDIILFDKNPYVLAPDQTKIAGFPDLIVEIWSKGNPKQERAFKQALYSTGTTTEHWYFTQNSNSVTCFFAAKKLKNQSLKQPLQTLGGVTVDLRHLAV